MKKIFSFLLMSFCITGINAQTGIKDSLKLLLQKEQADTSRALLLADLSFEYIESKPDTAMALALEALSISRRTGFIKGEALSLNRVGNVYNVLGNYPKAMEIFLQALKINEKLGNLDGIRRNLVGVGNIYFEQGDYRQALEYLFKAKALAEKINNKRSIAVILINIGANYYRLKIFDSARIYTQQSYDVASGINYVRIIGGSLINMGDIHFETGQNNLALEYYRLSIPYSKKEENDLRLSQTFLGIAKVFEKNGQYDSVHFYAKQSFLIARGKGFTKEILDAGSFLSSFYKKRQNVDSAFFYLEVAKAANDSMFNQQNVKQLQNMTVDEKFRQEDIAIAALKAKEERRHNLEYVAIIVSLLTFLIFFLALSRSIIVKQKFIKFCGILGLLAVFEFINLYIHPYLAHITNHSPLWMLLILIGIGALLVPLHHWLEKWITRIIIEKNKKLRLAAAKKTIEELEIKKE